MLTVCGHSELEYHNVAHYTDQAGVVEVTQSDSQSVLTVCSHLELEYHIVALYMDQAGAFEVTQSVETVCGPSAGHKCESHYGPALDLVVKAMLDQANQAKAADHAPTAGADH